MLLQVFNLQIDMAEIFSLHSNQEKNDTCFILCINHAKMIGFKNVVIRSSNIDRVFIFLCHACDVDITIYLDTEVGKKRYLINVSEKAKEFGKEWCKILFGVMYLLGKTVLVLSKVKVKSHL